MKKFFILLPVVFLSLSIISQEKSYYWYNANKMCGVNGTLLDSELLRGAQDVDTLLLLLPRTFIKTDTVIIRDTTHFKIHTTLYINKCKDSESEKGNSERFHGGKLPGVFSISANKKVRFSMGNLQYQASTKIWRFAEHQYDIIGESNSNLNNIYDGWIDLFGWGTATHPEQTNRNLSLVNFIDWGTNHISNGGNELNQWRTLTSDEWNYLLIGRNNAKNLLGTGCIDGKNGIILLPDNCTLTEEMGFISLDRCGFSLVNNYYYKQDVPDYFCNQYTTNDWKKLEALGAVFLPASGFMHNGNVDFVGKVGRFWSSSSKKTNTNLSVFQLISLQQFPEAFSLFFNSKEIGAKNAYQKSISQSVRLVCDEL